MQLVTVVVTFLRGTVPLVWEAVQALLEYSAPVCPRILTDHDRHGVNNEVILKLIESGGKVLTDPINHPEEPSSPTVIHAPFDLIPEVRVRNNPK